MDIGRSLHVLILIQISIIVYEIIKKHNITQKRIDKIAKKISEIKNVL